MNTDMYPKDTKELEKNIGYKFKNGQLLMNALYHSSYTNELRSKGVARSCNERLEFLGDSVLSLVTSSYLFNNYKNLTEGDLTRIRACAVCENALYEYALKISLGDYLYLGHGEEITNGRKRRSILADAFEALIAAIYTDGGYESVKDFVLPFVSENCKHQIKSGGGEDCKTLLQQFIQQNKGDILEYVLVKEEGPAHDKNFFVEVHLNNNVIGKGFGSTKREAEQCAAKEALILFGELSEDSASGK